MWLFGCLYVSLLALFAGHYWRRLRTERPELKFNFRITDIWAMMFGITPSCTLVPILQSSHFLEHQRFSVEVVLFVCGFVLAQATGAFIGRINIELHPHAGAKTAFQSAVSIVTGCMMGLLIGIFCTIVALFLTLAAGTQVGLVVLCFVAFLLVWSLKRVWLDPRM